MPEPAASDIETPLASERSRKRFPLVLLLLGIVALLCIVAVTAATVALARALRPERIVGIPLEVTRVAPASPLPSPLPPIVVVGDTQVALPVPVSLELGGNTFTLRPVDPTTEDWTAASTSGATWVYGTVVNYVIGLAATADNQSTLEGLSTENVAVLRLSSGAQFFFRVTQQRLLPPDDPSIFTQSRLGLTVVLLGEGEAERTVVFADFEQAQAPTPPASGPAASVGQAVQVGDALVTVLSGNAQTASPGLPAGMIGYLVEFTVRVTGQSSLNAGDFSLKLVDGVGNEYVLDPFVSMQGQAGLLQGPLLPGTEAAGSAGYLVPDGMAGPELTWVFAPQANAELSARFTIPYNPPVIEPSWPDVTVTDAFLGEGGDILHVVGRLRNAGAATLTVTGDDVSLSSSAGLGDLFFSSPPLPWTLAGGDSMEFELEFNHPGASSAIVDILGYTFEISGL